MAAGALSRPAGLLLVTGATAQAVTILGADQARAAWLVAGAIALGGAWIAVRVAAARSAR